MPPVFANKAGHVHHRELQTKAHPHLIIRTGSQVRVGAYANLCKMGPPDEGGLSRRNLLNTEQFMKVIRLRATRCIYYFTQFVDNIFITVDNRSVREFGYIPGAPLCSMRQQ